MKFAVIGGDMRGVKLAEMLISDGHTLSAALLERAESRVFDSISPVDAIMGAEYIVLPLPAAQDDMLRTPLSGETISLAELAGLIAPGQRVLGGKLPAGFMRTLRERGIECYDYFEREELTVRNAAATAEGALGILLEELPVTLTAAPVLVIGFGRIGKLLALKLRALGADVTVSARSFADFAWIESLGLAAADTRRLEGTLGRYAAVVNTVPAAVLGEARLRELAPGCLCLDLASKPGGVDFPAAARLGVRALWALSLPGRTAPVTSGAAIKETIYNIISELECAN